MVCVGEDMNCRCGVPAAGWLCAPVEVSVAAQCVSLTWCASIFIVSELGLGLLPEAIHMDKCTLSAGSGPFRKYKGMRSRTFVSYF